MCKWKKNWSSRDQNVAIFCFSLNYYKTNAKSVVFGSTAVTNEINTVFGKKIKILEIMIFWLPNLDFSRKKT